MGISVVFSDHQIAVHLFSKMKAFVAVLSALVAAASGEPQILANYGYGLAGYGGYYGYPGYATHGLTYAAPAIQTVAAAPAPAVTVAAAAPAVVPTLAYNCINPYDYAGQVYPVAEPYIHQEIPAEEYVHTEIAAEPYVHEEIPAEPYVHTEIPAEPYIHAEVLPEPYIHQEPVAVVAAPAPLVAAAAPVTVAAAPVQQVTYAQAPIQYTQAIAPANLYNYAPANLNFASGLAYNYGAYPYGFLGAAALKSQ